MAKNPYKYNPKYQKYKNYDTKKILKMNKKELQESVNIMLEEANRRRWDILNKNQYSNPSYDRAEQSGIFRVIKQGKTPTRNELYSAFTKAYNFLNLDTSSQYGYDKFRKNAKERLEKYIGEKSTHKQLNEFMDWYNRELKKQDITDPAGAITTNDTVGAFKLSEAYKVWKGFVRDKNNEKQAHDELRDRFERKYRSEN